MEARIILNGNLTADAEKKEKADGQTYHMFTIAANRGKNEPTYYTCFAYGISDERAKLLRAGSLVYVYGVPTSKISDNPKTGEKEISHTVNVRELDIMFSKKDD